MRLTKHLKTSLAALALGIVTLFPNTQTVFAETIALSVPISGDFSEIGRDFSTGAKLAMEQLGDGHELFIVDDGCDAALSTLAVDDILEKSPAIITGIICNEAALTYANELSKSDIPLLIAGARSVRLTKDRERYDWNLWRMSPGDDAAAEAIAKHITENLKDSAFAIVDDGTVFGRSLTDTIRLKLNEAGMQPQFADTFRAAQSTQSGMLRRLQRSGVEFGFIAAATQEDLFTVVKDHTSLKIENKLVVTEQLSILPFLEGALKVKDGIMVMMQPTISELEATSELTTLLKDREIAPTKAIYDGYAAIEIALSVLGKTNQETAKNLSTKSFGTITGPVKFDKQGKNIHNPYRLYIWQDGMLKPLDETSSL